MSVIIWNASLTGRHVQDEFLVGCHICLVCADVDSLGVETMTHHPRHSRHLTLVRDESIVVPVTHVNELATTDILGWAQATPAPVTPSPAKRELPSPPALEGWRFHVTQHMQGYIVAGRRGSLIVRKEKLTYDQVEAYVPS